MGIVLTDKSIIVTGSTTGIGEAITRRCVKEGARVLIHGRDHARGEALAKELGPAAVFCPGDLADPNTALHLVSTAEAAFGRIDGIVNNAANTSRSNVETTSPEVFDRMIATNLRAPLLLIQSALRFLKHSKGCAINIGSTNGYCGEPNLLAYSVSKAGLQTLSRNLANALGPDGVRIYHFNVGWVLTDNERRNKKADGLSDGWDQRLPRTRIPSGRMTRPEEIANVAAFFLSDEARPFSGTVVELEQFPFLGRNLPKEEHH